jgi:hypothetical protein
MEQKFIRIFGSIVMILGALLVWGATGAHEMWVIFVIATTGFLFLLGGYATYLKGGGKPFVDHPWPIRF